MCLRNVLVQSAIVLRSLVQRLATQPLSGAAVYNTAAVRFRGPEHGSRGVPDLQHSRRQIPRTKNEENGTPLDPGVHDTAAVRRRNPKHGCREVPGPTT